MIKNILLPHDGSVQAESATQCALWLAKRFEATVTGLNVVDRVALEGSLLHDISGSMGFEPFLDFSSKMRAMLEESGSVILNNFVDRCKKERIRCHEVLASGIVSNEISEHAKLADLVVMGRRGANVGFEYGLMGSVTEAVIRKSSKPVLIVSEGFSAPKSALVCYDGGVSASRALHSAAEISKTFALPLTVLSLSMEEDDDGKLKAAQDYLEPYKVDAEFVHIKGEVPSDIIKYLIDTGPSLVFIGSSHHSRVVKLVLGSTTESVIRALDIPFFIER